MIKKIFNWFKQAFNSEENSNNSSDDFERNTFSNYSKEEVKAKKEDSEKIKSVSLSLYALKHKRKLLFNFVPKLQANRNLRTYLEHKDGHYKAWQAIRNACEENAGGVCVFCSGSSKDFDETRTTNTEAHEEWFYKIDKNGRYIQRLIDIQACCYICHHIKHLNQHDNEKESEYFQILLQRYAEINEIDLDTAIADYYEALEEVENLSTTRFQLDLAFIEKDKSKRYFDCHSNTFNNFLVGYKSKQLNNESKDNIIEE